MVSVIVPNYNHASFLNERINSVLQQTYKDFELIILDDCSSDNSREIIEHYRNDPQITHIVYNDINSGSTFKQWKKGVQLSKGKYIWIAESDDFSDKHFLEKALAVISTNEKVGLVFCDTTIVNKDEKVLDKWSYGHSEKIKKDSYIFNGQEFCFNNLIFKNIIPNASAVVFKKDIILKDWIDTTVKNCGDWKLWLNISLNYDVAYIPEYLNFFRRHENNVTQSLLLQKLESIKILKEFRGGKFSHDKKNKLYQSLLNWSFNPAAWIDEIQFNQSNFRYYFRNNYSFSSIKYFLKWTLENVIRKT